MTSASEMLRALNRDRFVAKAHAEGKILRALPLIADVVEAAERELGYTHGEDTIRRLREPLTALRDALEDK